MPKRTKKLSLTCLLAFILISFALASESKVVKVERVIDGDTIVLSSGEKVRLLGVDTPELHHPKKPVQCFAKEAKKFTKSRIKGQFVKLTFEGNTKDRYGRLLAWVWYGQDYKNLLNADIISNGYGFSYRKYPTSKLEKLNKLEKEAREKGKGLWNKDACNEYGAFPVKKDKSNFFYITSKGCCYHLKTCRTIAKSKRLRKVTRSEAIKLGKRACKLCKP